MIRKLLLIALLISCSSDSRNSDRRVYKYEKKEDVKPPKPNAELVLDELVRLKVKHPKIVLAQSKLETGNYRSVLTRTHNNIFGFRTSKGYLKFKDWKECCEYYKKWQDRHYKKSQHTTYYSFLSSIGYAEDTNYIAKVKSIANERSRKKIK